MSTQNPTPDATATPRTQAFLCSSRNEDDISAFMETLERELTAAKAEIARVTADFDRVTSTLYDRVNDVIALKDRAERAEAELRERTQWQCKCGGTDCVGQAENERLKVEVERLKQFFTDGRVNWDALNSTIAKVNSISEANLAENVQLRARVGDLENDLEKSKHEADDWHRAWETVTEQAKKEVTELEQDKARLVEALKSQEEWWAQNPSGVDLEADEANASPEDAVAHIAGLATIELRAAIDSCRKELP